jgi:hypothetical protein
LIEELPKMSLREFFKLLNNLSGNSIYNFQISPLLEKQQKDTNVITDPIEMETVFENWGK